MRAPGLGPVPCAAGPAQRAGLGEIGTVRTLCTPAGKSIERWRSSREEEMQRPETRASACCAAPRPPLAASLDALAAGAGRRPALAMMHDEMRLRRIRAARKAPAFTWGWPWAAACLLGRCCQLWQAGGHTGACVGGCAAKRPRDCLSPVAASRQPAAAASRVWGYDRCASVFATRVCCCSRAATVAGEGSVCCVCVAGSCGGYSLQGGLRGVVYIC
jgi:hypothetical protein